MTVDPREIDYSDWEFVGLADGEAAHAAAPATFEIPSREDRERVEKGDCFKLMFRVRPPGGGEADEIVHRMWVEAVEDGRFRGVMGNHLPIDGLRTGDPVEFGPEHVVGIVRADEPVG